MILWNNFNYDYLFLIYRNKVDFCRFIFCPEIFLNSLIKPSFLVESLWLLERWLYKEKHIFLYLILKITLCFMWSNTKLLQYQLYLPFQSVCLLLSIALLLCLEPLVWCWIDVVRTEIFSLFLDFGIKMILTKLFL